MFGGKNILVVWVSRNQLEILGGKIEEVERIVFPEDVISNLEVLNRDAVYELIKAWTTKKALGGAEIVWLFGQDVFFERSIPIRDQEKDESEIIKFLELLPFEEVDSRVYVTSERKRVVAINRKLYKTLRTGFAIEGFNTKAEIPLSILDEKLVPKGMDKEVYLQVTSHLSDIVKNRLVKPELSATDKKSEKEDSETKSYLPILVGFFMILLVVLIIMLT